MEDKYKKMRLTYVRGGFSWVQKQITVQARFSDCGQFLIEEPRGRKMTESILKDVPTETRRPVAQIQIIEIL